jgi:hypothetical protein
MKLVVTLPKDAIGFRVYAQIDYGPPVDILGIPLSDEQVKRLPVPPPPVLIGEFDRDGKPK